MTKTLQFVLGFVAVGAIAACYNTSSVTNGSLVCSSDKKCPDSFACQSDGYCWKNGTAPGSCGPFATCSASENPAGSECDPVCQSGCKCGQRCDLDPSNSKFGFVCKDTSTQASLVQPLGTCSESAGTLCAPGSICMADAVCPNLCYETCRADQDCSPNTFCTQTVISSDKGAIIDGVYLCSPPTEVCNPAGLAACGTPRSGFKCVFLAGLTGDQSTDAVVCDCATLHTKKLGEACMTTPDDCQPGLVCIDKTCHTVCNRAASAAACPKGVCTPIYGSTRHGYCP
jgi:hypothetical protein